MKKLFPAIASMIILFILCTPVFAAPAAQAAADDPREARVQAVYAAHRKQLHADLDPAKTISDTIWILLDDGSFRQYIIRDDMLQLYGCGNFEPDAADPDTLYISRTHKYMEGKGFGEFYSVHPEEFHADAYVQIVSPGTSSGEVTQICAKPDACLIRYADDTYEEYTKTDNTFTLSRSGTGSPEDTELTDFSMLFPEQG